MAAPTGQALIVVDVQRDFCTGGSLAVPNGNAVIPPLNDTLRRCHAAGSPVYASRDWHPAVTRHFKDHGGPWPPHCVAGTVGAEFHPDLQLAAGTIIVSKGQTSTAHGYSVFEGTIPSGASLPADLERRGIRRLLVGGLATDYCVRQTVLDALQAGFDVVVATDAVAGVDLEPGDLHPRAGRHARRGCRDTDQFRRSGPIVVVCH